MFGFALAATLLLLQHSSMLKGENSTTVIGNTTSSLPVSNRSSVTVLSDSDAQLIPASSLSSDANANSTGMLDDEYDFGDGINGSSSNVTGRHAYHYRPAPGPPTAILHLSPTKDVYAQHLYGGPPPPSPLLPPLPPPVYLEPCTCLPFYLCKVKDIVGRTDGDGLIDQRSNNNKNGDSSSSLSGNELNKKRGALAQANVERSIEGGNGTSGTKRSSFYVVPGPVVNTPGCRPNHVCCRDEHGIPPGIPAPPGPSKQIYPGPPPPPPPPPGPLLPPPGPPPPPKQAPICGVRSLNGIVGRVKNPVFVEGDTQFGEFPWHVGILKNDETGRLYICAGALISDQYVLTAAHNIKGYNPGDMRIRLGDWDVSGDGEIYPFIERLVTEIYVHPYFYGGNLQNDLAILRLDQPVDFGFNTHISPICLPPRFESFAGARCVVTGWGKDAWGLGGQYSHILKKVDLPVLDSYDCQEKLRYTRLGGSFVLHPGFLCAGGEPGKDACKGDGGGPLVCEFDGRYVLTGVVSWGIGCGLPGVPGVYMRVSEYLDWINSIVYGH